MPGHERGAAGGHGEQAEAGGVAVAPFVVVHERPVKVAADVVAGAADAADGGEMAEEVDRAPVVIGVGDAILGDDQGFAVAAGERDQLALEALGVDGPAQIGDAGAAAEGLEAGDGDGGDFAHVIVDADEVHHVDDAIEMAVVVGEGLAIPETERIEDVLPPVTDVLDAEDGRIGAHFADDGGGLAEALDLHGDEAVEVAGAGDLHGREEAEGDGEGVGVGLVHGGVELDVGRKGPDGAADEALPGGRGIGMAPAVAAGIVEIGEPGREGEVPEADDGDDAGLAEAAGEIDVMGEGGLVEVTGAGLDACPGDAEAIVREAEPPEGGDVAAGVFDAGDGAGADVLEGAGGVALVPVGDDVAGLLDLVGAGGDAEPEKTPPGPPL